MHELAEDGDIIDKDPKNENVFRKRKSLIEQIRDFEYFDYFAVASCSLALSLRSSYSRSSAFSISTVSCED